MSMVGFPLLLIPLAIYNIIVFLMPGVSFAEPLVTLPLTSGAQWPVTLSDVLLSLGILMLLLEVIKGARPGAKFLTDHLLSLIVFGAALAEFLLWPRFASSAYFLLTLLALVDFLSGVALRVRRGARVTVAASRSARPIPVEARQEPADLPAVQPAPVNEPIIPAPSEPTFAHPETSAAPASEPAAGPQAGSASPPPETAH
ncbi:MAG: hypothetical protein WBV83_10225 [Bradyrhizobium sp.]|uniref:hypothetical protein n=1 Tax=Bradyrhizobium sp. TaxID=376 RepID=UPI003C4D2032